MHLQIIIIISRGKRLILNELLLLIQHLIVHVHQLVDLLFHLGLIATSWRHHLLLLLEGEWLVVTGALLKGVAELSLVGVQLAGHFTAGAVVEKVRHAGDLRHATPIQKAEVVLALVVIVTASGVLLGHGRSSIHAIHKQASRGLGTAWPVVTHSTGLVAGLVITFKLLATRLQYSVRHAGDALHLESLLLNL